MQTYIVSFAVLLCLGISVRLLHPASAVYETVPFIVGAFFLAGAVFSLLYRNRVLAFLLLIAGLCTAFQGLPADYSLSAHFIWTFAVLAVISLVLAALKINGLVLWMCSALFLGYGITSIHKDIGYPTHLAEWATDNSWGQQSLVYGTVVKEPEIRPEVNDTRLTIQPSVIAHLRDPEAKAKLAGILEVLQSTGREWDNEGEAFATLLEARDRLQKLPEDASAERKKEVVIDTFSSGSFEMPEEMVETVFAALNELSTENDPYGNGWIGRITTGWIFATIKDTEEQAQTYLDLSYYTGYGDVVKIVGGVKTPFPASNPGGFDYRRLLNNTNYFAMMTITGTGRNDQEPDTIEIIEEKLGNPFIAWCLSIKYKMLDVIRMTTPFPDSGFLSGIFLGLRRGVPEKIMVDSRAAGTAHVFAVSGLHVTIITALILLIFSQTPIPKTIWAPIAVLFLLVFTIITGARPSTLRAAIMNIFVLVFFTYFGKNIQKSLIMAICFAAIIILTVLPAGYGGPLIMPEASFLMSFSAVLFLGLLSQPVEHFLNLRLNSLFRFVLFVLIWVAVGLFFMNLENPLALFTSKLLIGLAAAAVVAFFIQGFLPFRVRFSAIPSLWLRQFIAAQIAIQCSIIPLSAVIFHRISLAAPFANFVAIPLIGVVLPLGMLATLIGMIPGVGIYVALVLTAANWLGMRFFLIWDDFWARLLPYPQVPEWGSPILILFYAGVLIFIFREKLALNLKIAFLRVRAALAQGANRVRFGVASGALLISAAALLLGFKTVSRPELTVTMLDLSYPARGMAALIQTPDGSNILVDGGFEGKWGYQKRYVNQGQRGTPDVLLAQGVISFDAVVSSSFDSSLLGGLNVILASDDYFVRKLYTYLPPEKFGPQDVNLNRFKECLAPHFRSDANHLYETLLLGYWTSPITVMEFQNYFDEVGEQELDEFISSLDSAAQTAADNALADFTENKKEKHEELIESILSTYQMLNRPLENREEAETIARKWDMTLLSTEDYRTLATELPPIAVWYIYQQGGVVHSIEGLEGYLNELKKKFVEAVGDTKNIYREDERFLQYHRLIYTVWKKKIPVTASHYGMNVIKPREVNGMPLSVEILNPPEKRFTGTYVSDANSTVMHVRFGDYSVLFTSLINQEASEWLLTLPEDELKSTIYQVPEFGKGGRYVNSDLMLDRVKPEVAVFHYKSSRYVDKGYEEVAGLCAAKGIKTFNTPEDGAVIIHIFGDSYQVESMLGGMVEEELDVADDNAAPDREKELGTGF